MERQEEVEKQEETGAKVAKVRPWGGTHKNGHESIPIGPFSVAIPAILVSATEVPGF